jgi:hypothetical protein
MLDVGSFQPSLSPELRTGWVGGRDLVRRREAATLDPAGSGRGNVPRKDTEHKSVCTQFYFCPQIFLCSVSDNCLFLASPLCRKCGAEGETSAHILCSCEVLACTRHAHLGSFLSPEDIKRITLGAIWRFGKAAGLL